MAFELVVSGFDDPEQADDVVDALTTTESGLRFVREDAIDIREVDPEE